MALFRAKTIAFKRLGFSRFPAFLNLKITQNRAVLEMGKREFCVILEHGFWGKGSGERKQIKYYLYLIEYKLT